MTTNNTEHIVHGCSDCLLRDVLESGSSWCFHPKKSGYLYEDGNGDLLTPYDCPLVKETFTIRLIEDEDN